jgi:hypothetical protein
MGQSASKLPSLAIYCSRAGVDHKGARDSTRLDADSLAARNGLFVKAIERAKLPSVLHNFGATSRDRGIAASRMLVGAQDISQGRTVCP